MKQRESDLLVQMAQCFIEQVQQLDPEFVKAYFRFYKDNSMHESCASYQASSEVFIVSAFTLDEFFDQMDNLCVELLTEMKRDIALLLLTVDNDLKYEVKFEYDDMEKWRISLLEGGKGIPF